MVSKRSVAASGVSDSEAAILTFFRRFNAGPNQMLFFNSGFAKSHSRQFLSAMQSLVDRGYVVKERPREAYSLTSMGYQASLAAAA